MNLYQFAHSNPQAILEEKNLSSLAYQILKGVEALHKEKIYLKLLNPSRINVSQRNNELKISIKDALVMRILQLK